MYEITTKFRYALKWFAFGAAGLAVLAAVLASAMPYLIEDRAVHDSLIRRLSAWSGGPVTVRGPLRVASFSSLSIVADGVRFAATPRLSPIGKIEAKSVTAILKLRSLLSGKLEFKKVVVASPRIIFKRRVPASKPAFFGLETAGAAVAFAELSHFEELELHDCVFLTASDERRAYSRFEVERIKLGTEAKALRLPAATQLAIANPRPYTLYLGSQGFEVFFRGNLSRAEEKASGIFQLKAPLEHPAAAKITAAVVPWEQGHSVSIAGNLTWSGARAALDGATISFGDHSAKGSLALAVRRGRALLEGTLAYDRLEWMPARKDGTEESAKPMDLLKTFAYTRPSMERRTDLDMRISAERFQAGPYEAGPLALALTSRQDRFSIDIAELALFGGKIAGRLDYDSSHPEALSLNANGTRLNSYSLTDALGWPFSVSGPVSVRLALELPFKDEPLAQTVKAASGSFAVKFPAGGSLDGEVSQRLSAAVVDRDAFWGADSNTFPFSTASIEGSSGPGGVEFNIDGEHEGRRIAGSLRVASPGDSVSGSLSISEATGSEDGSPPPAASPAPSNIMLSGTVAALSFSPSGKTSLSN